ncbi:MAG TPA: DUF4411 family protein [Stellaceae bacterium]
MLYLLDANVLITANNSYYPLDAVPEFWEWLTHKCGMGDIKMPIETFEEVRDGGHGDPLFLWVQDDSHRRSILFDEEVQPDLVQQVMAAGYARDLTDDEIEQVGQDPFLVAHALRSPADRCVVTTEVSKTRVQRANRRIPDVCLSVGVTCCDTFAMLRALRFSTQWQR